MAQGQRRPCEPRPVEGDVGDRELPHGGTRRPCRALPGLRRHKLIAYNSCRNRHCPKCQGAASRRWLADREAELLPIPYYHVVFTLPARSRDIAYQNKAVIYDLLFKASAETMITIAADPKHLGARIGITSVLHTWGSALTHHPHVHMIVPGGGLSLDGARGSPAAPASSCASASLAAVPRLFLEKLAAAHAAGRCNSSARTPTSRTSRRSRASSPRCGARMGGVQQGALRGPEAVLAICRATPTASPSPTAASLPPTAPASRSGTRITASTVRAGKRYAAHPHEFIRRFLMHVLPTGFHRIRHYGLFASGTAPRISRRPAHARRRPARRRPATEANVAPEAPRALPCPCPRCGGRMIIIEASHAAASRGGGRRRAGRHIMSQTACKHRRFPVHWLDAGGDPLGKTTPINDPTAARYAPRRHRDPHCALPGPLPHSVQAAWRQLRAHRHNRRENRIPIARLPTRPPNSPATFRASTLFGRRLAERAESFVAAGVQKPVQQRTWSDGSVQFVFTKRAK